MFHCSVYAWCSSKRANRRYKKIFATLVLSRAIKMACGKRLHKLFTKFKQVDFQFFVCFCLVRVKLPNFYLFLTLFFISIFLFFGSRGTWDFESLFSRFPHFLCFIFAWRTKRTKEGIRIMMKECKEESKTQRKHLARPPKGDDQWWPRSRQHP